MAQIKLKKLTGIQVGTEVINASGDFKTKVEALVSVQWSGKGKK